MGTLPFNQRRILRLLFFLEMQMEFLDKLFSKESTEEKEASELKEEAKNFKLPGEGIPTALKYIFFIGLAILNFRLFAETVPGAWGMSTGAVAVVSEVLILYASHNFSRSAGAFRWALMGFGSALMVFSIVHATFSIVDLMSAGSPSPAIIEYAKHYAFPILAGLVGVGTTVICALHPINLIRFKQALAHTKIATGRAEVASEMELIRAQNVLDNAKLAQVEEKNQREEKFLTQIQQTIKTQERKIAMINGIADPALREEMARKYKVALSSDPYDKLPPAEYDERPKAKPSRNQ